MKMMRETPEQQEEETDQKMRAREKDTQHSECV